MVIESDENSSLERITRKPARISKDSNLNLRRIRDAVQHQQRRELVDRHRIHQFSMGRVSRRCRVHLARVVNFLALVVVGNWAQLQGITFGLPGFVARDSSDVAKNAAVRSLGHDCPVASQITPCGDEC